MNGKIRTLPGLFTSVAVLALLQACGEMYADGPGFEVAEVTSIRHATPKAITRRSARSSVSGSTREEAAQNVVVAMQAAGISSVRVHGATSVTGVTNAPTALDCGTLLIKSGRNTQRVPVNATLTVLPVPGSNDFVRRQFQTTTRYVVDIAPMANDPSVFGARVGGDHEVRIMATSLDGKRKIEDYRSAFDYGTRGVLDSSIECESSDLLDRIIWE